MRRMILAALMAAAATSASARDSLSEVLDGDLYLQPRQSVKHRHSTPASVSGTAELPPLPPETVPETPTAQVLEAPKPEPESSALPAGSTTSTESTKSITSSPLAQATLRTLSAQSLKEMGIDAKWETKDVLLITLSAHDTRFQSGKDKIRPAALTELKAVAYSLRLYDWVQWRVDGHADRRGSAAGNQDLSQRRALEVAAALVNLGMPADKLAGTWGWSYKRPLVKGRGAEALGMNRRVELRISRNEKAATQ